MGNSRHVTAIVNAVVRHRSVYGEAHKRPQVLHTGPARLVLTSRRADPCTPRRLPARTQKPRWQLARSIGVSWMQSPPCLTANVIVWDADNTGPIPNSSALRWERDAVSSLFGRALTRARQMLKRRRGIHRLCRKRSPGPPLGSSAINECQGHGAAGECRHVNPRQGAAIAREFLSDGPSPWLFDNCEAARRQLRQQSRLAATGTAGDQHEAVHGYQLPG
jgi:hypothetical protein